MAIKTLIFLSLLKKIRFLKKFSPSNPCLTTFLKLISSVKLKEYLSTKFKFIFMFEGPVKSISFYLLDFLLVFLVVTAGKNVKIFFVIVQILLKVVAMSTNYRIHLLHDKRIFQRLYISVFLLLIIGNDILHYLLTQGMYEMRMDMADFDNQTSYVKYNSLNVGDEASKYRVTLHGYSGNVGEILQICVFYHFSAKV